MPARARVSIQPIHNKQHFNDRSFLYDEHMADSMAIINESFYSDCGNISPLLCDQKHYSPNNNVFEDEIILAWARDAQETGCFTPLIKEELKLKIQERRLASGKDELVLEDSKPNIHELTAADVRRREVRKEQNRRAARKYRVKQRTKVSIFRKEMDKLESDNHLLMDEIKKLHQEKNELFQILQKHLQQCVLSQLPTSPEPWQITDSALADSCYLV